MSGLGSGETTRREFGSSKNERQQRGRTAHSPGFVFARMMDAYDSGTRSPDDLASAPLYLLAGLVILLVHAVIMLLAARLLRLDLFTCGVASLANIGGVASAPILAAAYSRQLVPVGVLMALLGYVVGTAGGLLVGRVLMWLGGVNP